MTTLRVLHVEDSERDAALLTRHLSRAGYELISERVEAPEAMRAALDRQECDVILCDYSMPHFNALSALALLKEMRVDIPFIIISGTVGEAVAVEAMRAGAHDYLMKDNLVRLAPTIERELKEAENRRARRHAEEALQASELRYRRLFESAKDGILILEPVSGQIVDVNPFLIDLLGYSKEELVGKELWEIGVFKDVIGSKAAFVELQQQGYIRYENLPLETRDGLVKQVEFVSNRYLAGKSRVIQCNIRDITERKRFERELREKNLELENANLAKDRFLASMSHELRTPLNAIIGFTGTLLMKLPGPLTSDQEQQLRTVQSSAKHLHSLINDLLDVAKIESGKVEIKHEPVICQGVVAEVAAALRPLAEKKGLYFKVKTPQASVRVESDRRVLSQILINLTSNAIKYTDQGKVQIELGTQRSNGQTLATIEVSDTGIGIRPEDKQKLFQAFQQVDDHYQGEGTGLGLYLSQKLAVLIKGRIELESEYGIGSVFRLLIPED
jgi:PAS domain S-box-containing protein